VLNYCRTHIRRRASWTRLLIPFSGSRPEDERSYEVLDSLPDNTYDPAKTTEQRRLADDILSAVRALPDIYRNIMVMREVNELSYEEIAEILGISIGTVKSRISRARDLVKMKVKLE
jgi:RNA polymerase sigma-70 factor (ECF subfamily)